MPSLLPRWRGCQGSQFDAARKHRPRHDADAVIVEVTLLTPAERETLQALAQLGSYSQVAKATNCSITTVKRRLAPIYEKLKVKSAPQAVAIAICYGLISLSR